MAIRNWIFSTLQQFTQVRAASKLDCLVAMNRNEKFSQRGEFYKSYTELGKQLLNNERILVSQMDDLSRQKYEILKRYNHEGLNNENVDADAVMMQVDRISFLQKLKMMEDNPAVYGQEEIEFYRLQGKVHLEEENATENLEKYLIKKPWMRKYTILSHI